MEALRPLFSPPTSSSLSWVPDFSFSASSFSPSVSHLSRRAGLCTPSVSLLVSSERSQEPRSLHPLPISGSFGFYQQVSSRPTPRLSLLRGFSLILSPPAPFCFHFWSSSWHLREQQETLLGSLVLPSTPCPGADLSLPEPGFPYLDLTRSLPS